MEPTADQQHFADWLASMAGEPTATPIVAIGKYQGDPYDVLLEDPESSKRAPTGFGRALSALWAPRSARWSRGASQGERRLHEGAAALSVLTLLWLYVILGLAIHDDALGFFVCELTHKSHPPTSMGHFMFCRSSRHTTAGTCSCLRSRLELHARTVAHKQT